jgi:hypothetical protein
MAAEFAFEIDQKVITPMGKPGMIQMCAIDQHGDKTYFVQKEIGGEWVPERLLKAGE